MEAEVIKRSDDVQGFQVLPRRWVLQWTFGWVVRYRGLVRDHERIESSVIGGLIVALVPGVLGRLA